MTLMGSDQGVHDDANEVKMPCGIALYKYAHTGRLIGRTGGGGMGWVGGWVCRDPHP
jgi:hypothetical protein